jgi:glycosyltransferase involved in cell wall biosynthesis
MDRIAVLIPCYNEQHTIGKVVRDFKAQLPDADIYVYDNNSTDNSSEEALKAGATVRQETRQGKGNVMRSMFHQIDADIYVMVDGDSTYPADKVHDLIKPIQDGTADMTIGSRLHSRSKSQFKLLNRLGNKLFLFLMNTMFNVRLTDLLSGYRAFNRNIVILPLLSKGFDIETELTLKTIERNHRIKEIPVDLIPRPEGSSSKISIIGDGFLIFNAIFSVVRDYKPLTAFGLFGLMLVLCGFVPGYVVVKEFIETGVVLHVPLAILSVGVVLSGLFVIFIGLVLHTIAHRFQELDYQLQNLAGKAYGMGKEGMNKKG